MPAAGNTGGAGGAKNVARAQRKPKRANVYVPPAILAKPVRPKPAPQAAAYVSQGRAVQRAANQATAVQAVQRAGTQATSQRKRASRVAVSAQRKRTGGVAPIIVRRRQDVQQQGARLKQLETSGKLSGALASTQADRLKILERSAKSTGALTKGPVVKATPKPKLKASGVTGAGILGTVTGAAKFADKALSGESFLSKGANIAASALGTAGESAVTGRYLKKPLAAVGVKWAEPHGAAKTVSKVTRNAFRDAVDIPAGLVPSFYVPGKEGAKAFPALAKGDVKGAIGHQVKASKTFVDPIVHTVEHPAKSFVEHPLGTAAILGGVEGAIGRGAGAALRKGAAGKAGRRVARTERAPRTIPGTPQRLDRTYDPDVLRKGVQVAGEKIAARGRKKRGEPAGRRMTTKDINNELNLDVRISRNASTLADERAAVNVAHAANPPRKIGRLRVRRKVRNKPVTAAHTVAVQNLAPGTEAGLKDLLAKTKAAAKELGGDKLRKNQQRQAELEKALKHWKPGTEAHVRDVHERLREQAPDEEAALIKAGVLDASRADANRYSTAATRPDIALHDPTTAAGHVADAGRAAAKAASAVRGAFRKRLAANSALREQTAKTRAAELGPRGETRAGTTAAERELRGHEKTLQKAKEQEARDLAAARQELDDARHAAELTTKEISPHPDVQAAKARVDKANSDLQALVREAAGRERISGRQEGRAQEKVAAHERARTVTGRRLSEEADRRQAELAVHNRTLATVEGAPARGAEPYSPKQIEAVRRRRDAAQRRADAADEKLTQHHAQAPQRGTEPRGPLAALERRGGEDLQLRQRILAARAEVENAVSDHARAQARARGVPPKEADRLRKAITAHDDARLKFTNRDSLVHLRDAVDAAKAKLAYEQSKGGLEPAAAERLWKTIHDAEDATAAHTQAIADHQTATARHRALKDAPYIDAKGNPHTVDEVRNHPARAGEPDPIFMPHAYESSHGALPVNKVKAPNPVKQRTGLPVVEGTSPVAGGQITTARISRARMIAAAHNRIAYIDKWGYRDGVAVTEPPTVYSTKGNADAAAAAAEKVTGHPMTSFADQRTDGYVLVPKQTVEGPQGLQAHEETVLHRDQLMKQLGRAWRTGVLSLSTRWLTGQAAEPVFRVGVAHQFNPVKLARSYRILSLTAKELKANDPEAFAQFETQYKRGGLSRGVKISRDEALQDFIMRDSAQGLEAAMREFAKKPGIKTLHAMAGWHMRFWFHHLNGSIESLARRGLVGRELIKDPIVRDRKMALNFADAAKELAQGISDGPAANRFARNVDDSFGKYQGRSPKEQAIIENVTPFVPWFLSSMRFLYRVLPRDHPVLTGLTAAANQSTEEWRRKYGIYFDPSEAGKMGVGGTDINLPLAQQGSIPVGKNNEDVINPTHYLPTSGVTSFGDLGGYLVPQFADIQAASKGQDWRGYGLTGRGKPVSLERIAKATLAATITTLAPPAGVAAKLAGIHLPSEPDPGATDVPPDTSERISKQFVPLSRKPGLAKGIAEKKQKRKEQSKRANAARRRKYPPKGPSGNPLGGQAGSNPLAGQAGSNPLGGGG